MNKTLILKKVKYIPLVFCLGASSLYADQKIDLVSLYPKAQLFKTVQKGHQTYQSVEGRIKYITDLDGDADEGYMPERSTMLEGQVEKNVYDHTESDSAVEIAKNMREEIKRKGFEVVYECSQQECGDVAGWRLYLSRYIDGSDKSQYYTLAKHPNKESGEWTIVFYVNEFSGIPRSVLHVVDTSDVNFDRYVIKQSRLGIWLKQGNKVELEGLYFEFDSDKITENSSPVLESLLSVLNESPDMVISIEGHTDDLGADEYNLGLSLRRAESVKEYLVDNGIDPSRLSVEGYGESRPIQIDKTASAREKNRRVEVVAVKESG